MAYCTKAFSFKGKKMALAYLAKGESCILAIGTSRDSIADAILDDLCRFSNDEAYACLHAIYNLDICDKSDEDAIVIIDYWANAFASLITGQIAERGSKIRNIMNQVHNSLWVCLQATNTILYLSIDSNPRMLMVFSKQQAQLILAERGYKSDFEVSIAFRNTVSSGDLPEESDRAPLVCEGDIVALLISVFLTSDGNVLSDEINTDQHPWKHNFQNN